MTLVRDIYGMKSVWRFSAALGTCCGSMHVCLEDAVTCVKALTHEYEVVISKTIQSGENGVALEVIISPQECIQTDVSYPML